MRLFAQKGYGSTSVADILQAAGVNAGSLYYLYPGKQDVLLDVLDTYLAGIHPMLLAPAWEGISDPIERVFALLRRYRFALESTDCTYGCPIGSIALEIHEPDPPLRERPPGELRRMGRCDRAVLRRRGRPTPRRRRSARAGRVRAHDDGGRRDALPHPPYARRLRHRGRDASRARGSAPVTRLSGRAYTAHLPLPTAKTDTMSI